MKYSNVPVFDNLEDVGTFINQPVGDINGLTFATVCLRDERAETHYNGENGLKQSFRSNLENNFT